MFILETVASGAANTDVTSALNGLDLSTFAATYTEVAKVMLPVIIGIIAVKKGFSWIRRGIKGIG